MNKKSKPKHLYHCVLRERIKYNRILGEYMGTIQGILAWDLPEELRSKLEKTLTDLKSKE